jgi:hypothetical protein
MSLRVGWQVAVQVFLSGITQKSCLKPPGPDLIAQGGGAITPIWSYGEALSLASSHLRIVTQALLRS